MNVIRNGPLADTRVTYRLASPLARPGCPAKLLKIEREHPKLVDIPHGIGPDALELSPEH